MPVRLFALVAAGMWASSCAAATPQIDAAKSIIGTWKIESDFHENGKAGSLLPVGSLLEFSKENIRDPVTEDCPRNPDYSHFESDDATRFFHQHPAIKAHLPNDTALGSVRTGIVVCDGGNWRMLTLIGDDVMIYYQEGNEMAVLQRQ
jgi:hypothetical protein